MDTGVNRSYPITAAESIGMAGRRLIDVVRWRLEFSCAATKLKPRGDGLTGFKMLEIKGNKK